MRNWKTHVINARLICPPRNVSDVASLSGTSRHLSILTLIGKDLNVLRMENKVVIPWQIDV